MDVPPPRTLDELAYALLAQKQSGLVHAFLSRWPLSVARRPAEPSSLPVLHYLPALQANAAPFSATLVAAITRMAATLAWRRSYSTPAVSDQFLDNYGWTEFVGLNGCLHSEQLACGVLVLGADTLYPAHHHEAEEIYIPLSGVAAWQQGEGDWHEHPPGAIIHHPRHQSHAMRTRSLPLMALYAWNSADLSQSSQLDAPGRW